MDHAIEIAVAQDKSLSDDSDSDSESDMPELSD